MLFINVSNIEDSDFLINNQLKDTSEFKSTGLLEQIKQKLIINIDDYDSQDGVDFVYSCVGDENPQIVCKLNYEHMKTVRDFLQLPNIEKRKQGRRPKQLSKTQESTILSRDNFVNEIYTK